MSGSTQPVTQNWRAAEPRYPPHAMSYPVQIARPHAVSRTPSFTSCGAGAVPSPGAVLQLSGLCWGWCGEIRLLLPPRYGISSFLSCDPLPFPLHGACSVSPPSPRCDGLRLLTSECWRPVTTQGAHWGGAAALVSTGGRGEAWIAAHPALEHAGSGLFQRDLFRPAPRGEPHPLLGVGSSLPSTPVLGPQVPTIFSILFFPLFFPPSLPFDLCSHLPVDQAVS